MKPLKFQQNRCDLKWVVWYIVSDDRHQVHVIGPHTHTARSQKAHYSVLSQLFLVVLTYKWRTMPFILRPLCVCNFTPLERCALNPRKS